MISKQLVAIAGLTALTASSFAGGIKWNTDLATALKIAKKTNKPVMIDFTSDECGVCKWLDQTTFPDHRVIKFSERVVPLRVVLQKQPKVVKQFGITMATTMFLAPDGRVLGHFDGFHPPQEFIDESMRVLKSWSARTSSAGAPPAFPAHHKT
jgi:thioredoxin-like negative regulator of GroEL